MKQKAKGSQIPADTPGTPRETVRGHLPLDFTRGKFVAETMARFPTPTPQSAQTNEEASVIIEDKAISVEKIKYPFWIKVNDLYSLRVIGLLGSGSMGLVFKAVQEYGKEGKKKDGELKAVKIIYIDPKILGSDPEGEKREKLLEKFLEEVILVSKLKKSGNIIDIEVYGPTTSPIDGKRVPYYVMEFIDGKDLNAILNQVGCFEWERMAPLMVQMCSALTEAHKHGIVHLDIKLT
jgi:serine/threonine protein kinase